MYNLLNIKEVAIKNNISLKSLIVRVGISEPGFYKSLDNNSMNIKTLAKIAEVFQISISELIGDRLEGKPEGGLTKSKASPILTLPVESEKAEESLYKTMYEQSLELLNKEREISELKLEIERLKNVSAPVKDALAG